jgi:acyl-CoA dehydrogenase
MSATAADYLKRLTGFMVQFVFPAEPAYHRHRQEAGPGDHTVPPTVEELKALARASGLWNLFLPSVSGLSNLEYAPLAEVSGSCLRPKESSSYSWNLAASLI